MCRHLQNVNINEGEKISKKKKMRRKQDDCERHWLWYRTRTFFSLFQFPESLTLTQHHLHSQVDVFKLFQQQAPLPQNSSSSECWGGLSWRKKKNLPWVFRMYVHATCRAQTIRVEELISLAAEGVWRFLTKGTS